MSPSDSSGELRVGMVGYAFMGAAHSQAWRTVNHAFDLPLRVRMAAVCGRDEEKVRAAATRLGWERTYTDWRDLVEQEVPASITLASATVTKDNVAQYLPLGFES